MNGLKAALDIPSCACPIIPGDDGSRGDAPILSIFTCLFLVFEL